MSPQEAELELAILSEVDAQTTELADMLAGFMSNPALPMLMRVRAMSIIIGGAAGGLYEVLNTDGVSSLHRIGLIDQLPEIVRALRASADLFEAVHKERSMQ